MTASQLAAALAAKINALGESVTATAVGTKLILTATTAGSNSGLYSASLSVNGSEEDSTTFSGGQDTGMAVSPTSLSFPASGGVQDITISTNGSWAVGTSSGSSDEDYSKSLVRKVYNLAKETGFHRVVHLQSRPLAPNGYQYTHVHRLISMVRARLSSSENLSVSLYGSEDLTSWTLLSCAQKTNVKISQIRTPSAARSWRYYTIVTGGIVLPDTDMGPFIIDHQPVIRRIG